MLVALKSMRCDPHHDQLYGHHIAIDVAPDDQVGAVMEILFEKFDLPPCQQRLIHGGKMLGDLSMTLADYNIQKESTLQLVLNMRGS